MSDQEKQAAARIIDLLTQVKQTLAPLPATSVLQPIGAVMDDLINKLKSDGSGNIGMPC